MRMAISKLKLFHYTSRQFAQDISCSGILRPGPSGVVYLSPLRVDKGVDAAAILGGSGTVEFRCEVEVDSDSRWLKGPFSVEQIFNLDGIVYRPGGGVEYEYEGLIRFGSPPKWTELGRP
jgi:hypothetical protein